MFREPSPSSRAEGGDPPLRRRLPGPGNFIPDHELGALLVLVAAGPVVEGVVVHVAQFGSLTEGDLARPPGPVHRIEVFGQRLGGTAELDAPGFGGRDPLSLALADVFPLVLGHEGQDLQHHIGQERAQQILAAACVQKRHIQHNDIDVLFLGQKAPLDQDLLVVAAQPVDAFDVEQVVLAQTAYQPLVFRPLEILAGLPVHIYILGGYLRLAQGDPLAVVVLFAGADPDVAIDAHGSPSCLSGSGGLDRRPLLIVTL